MDSKIYLRYSIADKQDGFDLVTLGQSFIGFQKLLSRFFELSAIDGELEVRTEKISEGSIVLHTALHVLLAAQAFHSVKDFLNFLQIADPLEFQKAQSFFNDVRNVHKTLNDYFTEHGFDSVVFGYLLAKFDVKIFSLARLFKNSPVNPEKSEFPIQYGYKLNQFIKRGKFRMLITPLIEETVNKIEISTDASFAHDVKLNLDDIDDYLSEEEKILPDFKNGEIKNLVGEISGLSSTRGEVLKFKVFDLPKKYQLLVAYPPDLKTTEDFIQFYKKKVQVRGEVLRRNLYRKPELIIHEISLLQESLLDGLNPN